MSLDFASALAFVQSHGYAILLLALLIEGPIVTPAAGFAAFLGYFNLYAVMALCFLGNQIPDLLFFFLGRWSRRRVLKRHAGRFGFTDDRVRSVKEAVRRHGDKAIWIVKLTPFIAIPSIMIMAAAGYEPKRFILFSAIINLLVAIFIVGLGYSFGFAYASIAQYVHWSIAAIIAVAVLAIVIPVLYARGAKRVVEAIEKR